MTWESFWADVSVLQVVGWMVGIVAVVAFIRKGWPWLRRMVKLVDTLATLPEDLAVIRHELQRNGGGSVKDSVVRIEAEVKGLRSEVAHVKRQAASLKTSVNKANQGIARAAGDKP